jgi:hypothetical protein
MRIAIAREADIACEAAGGRGQTVPDAAVRLRLDALSAIAASAAPFLMLKQNILKQNESILGSRAASQNSGRSAGLRSGS